MPAASPAVSPTSTPPDEGYFFLDHDQRDTLSTGFNLQLPWRAWTDFNANYGSGFVDGEGPEHLPSHTTFDLSVGKSFGENWNVRLSGAQSIQPPLPAGQQQHFRRHALRQPPRNLGPGKVSIPLLIEETDFDECETRPRQILHGLKAAQDDVLE